MPTESSNNVLDHAFLRYQRTNNPDHLGEVFEGTAGRLLELAQNLAADMSAAEDLVQATFLTAIENQHKYEHKGHVFSWLFGIMVNEARVRRRAMGHNMEPLERRSDASPLQGPDEALEGKEISEVVMQAIAKMADPYRPVLSFHLRYGLSAGEIAINLHRHPATVRKQLSRGLELLRKALPASLIAGAAVLTTPTVGLSAMREVVMAKASAFAAKAAGASSALTLGKLGLMAGAGTLAAAGLAVSLFAPDVGQVTNPDVSPKAKAQVMAPKGSVDSIAPATVALQADPFPPSSRVLMTFSNPVPNAPGGANSMNASQLSPSSLSQKLGIPSLLMGAMTLLSAVSQGQSVIYFHNGDTPGGDLGRSANTAGDVNGDGNSDLVVGASNYDLDPDGTPTTGDELSGAGRVYVYSGKDGTTLWTKDGDSAGDSLGSSVSNLGDVNGDGSPDIVVGALNYDLDPDGTPATGDELSDAGRVFVYSGKDGTTLWTREGLVASNLLGYSVSDVQDVNLDGFPDIVASTWAEYANPDGTLGTSDDLAWAGRVYVFSGKDGTTLHTFDGENANDFLGSAASGAGDANADGFGDIAASANGYDADPDGTPATADELIGSGRVYAWSGKDGSLLWTKDGEAADDNLGGGSGEALTGVGDLNADGFDDVAAGAYKWSADIDGPDGTPGVTGPGPDGTLNTPDDDNDDIQGNGRVYVLSGKDGTAIHTIDGENGGVQFFTCCGGFVLWLAGGDNLGWSVGSAGDVDSDGYPDITIGAPTFEVDPDGTSANGDELTWAGRAYVYSGKSGTKLWSIDGGGASDFMGFSVDDAGDVNGDGSPDIVASARGWSNPAELGPDGTAGTGDETGGHGRAHVISGTPLSLTADQHLLSLSVANSQTMTIDAGIANAGKNYWLFTGFAASGDTPGVTMAPGVVIPLNQPDPLTSFVIGLTQLGGGAPTFTAWKSTLDGAGKASPSLNTFGPTPAPLGVTLHHAALVYTSNGCGLGCDTFQLASNWVPMTTTP